MLGDFKVVCVTPAGRKRYLAILYSYIKRAFGLVDEWHLWQNTGNAEDILFLEQLRAEDPRVRIIKVADEHPFCSGRIRSFFPHACDADTVYVRFDDDIVWMEESAIQRLAEYRLANPQYFLVTGNIINNPVCSYRHCRAGVLTSSKPLADNYACTYGLTVFGEEAHQQFLAQLDKSRFFLPNEEFPRDTRFGIQFCSWLGSRFAQFGGLLPHIDEENWLTKEAPNQWNQVNALCGDALAVHFAYTEQRMQLDSTDLLQRYAALASTL